VPDARQNPTSHAACARPYRLIAFDWDGTAVASRKEPADEVVRRVEPLGGLGVVCAVITGTNIHNLDEPFLQRVRPRCRHHLLACMNRGSEVFGYDADGQRMLLHRREATPAENQAMDSIAVAVRDELREQFGLATEIIFDRLNRRKLDLIPLPEWADPPKARIGELLEAVNARLAGAGLAGGIKRIMDRVERLAAQHGIDIRLTTDVKHVELGLTDKSDSVRYLLDQVAAPRGIAREEIVFLGDEFGPIDGFEGSDFKMVCAPGATFLSVGKEPNGVPQGVLHLGGGIPRFLEFLDHQAALHKAKHTP